MSAAGGYAPSPRPVFDRPTPYTLNSLYMKPATKKQLEAAIKNRVPRGQGASTLRAVLKAAEAAGGITRPKKHEVDLYRSSPKEG